MSPPSPAAAAPDSAPSATRRRFFAPEVIQTSAMDCGPAALKCLLEGFGVPVSYGRLREACQTSVDGTSIDTLEALASSLGLDAEQIMLPVDHLLLPAAGALPAIVVLRLPSGLTHFVVVWRVHGGFVQVMDPARGRRWVRRAAFLRDVYVHALLAPADLFRAWAGGHEFKAAIAHRLRAIDVEDRDRLIARADADPTWKAAAALDAAARTVTALVAGGGVRRGGEATGLLIGLLDGDSPPPALHATAIGAPDAADGTPQVLLRGAVLVRVSGAAPLSAAARAALPAELQAAVEEPPARASATLLRLARADGLPVWTALAAGIGAAALGAVGEALLLRALFDVAAGHPGRLGRWLGAAAGGAGRLGAAIGLALLVLLAVEWPLAAGLRGAGRRLEQRLRRLFLRKIPRLPDRYFHSRPVSDMAERAHRLHRVRGLPGLVGDTARLAIEIAVITAALVWLDPARAPLALALGAAMLAIPLAAQPALAERDLRMRNHAGALGRFYLDGLLGLTAVRAHAGEASLIREHGDRLAEWARAARDALRAALSAEAMQALVGFGLGAWLLADFLAGRAPAADPGTALLVVFWTLSLPALGQDLGLALQQLPAQRNLALRLVEPLGAPEDDAPPDDAAPPPDDLAAPRGVRVQVNDARVVVAGREVLHVGALALAPGEHVAIVGASGAGKSSLVGLLLGWYRPAAGSLLIDGRALDASALAALRRRTVWVDPSVYVWNRSLRANLTFGLPAPPADLSAALADAELGPLVRNLPSGVDTPLGEAGALVSGGEGQRVRFARGVLRARPRLVVLDEPFRGLARGQRAELLARARGRWVDATLVCVTHDIGETAGFARVLVVADGQIAEDGAPAVLGADPSSRYARLLASERRVRAGFTAGPAWRRVQLDGGRVVEPADPTKDHDP